MFSRRRILALLASTAAGCRESDGGSGFSEEGEAGAAAKHISLTGAGATFPYPLYSKWVSEYNRHNPGVRINYQSIGSGGGIRQIVARTVDFGASDTPIQGDEAKGAQGALVHLPVTIGAVAVSHNLEGLSAPLRLSSQALAGIFLGEIRSWSDERIAVSNRGIRLPAREIAVVVRTDGSGTTAIFSEYLASISPTFRDKVGAGKSVKWPIGLGAKGNEGVTGQLKTVPGAIGYIELAYATQNKLMSAHLENRAGRFVAPTVDAAAAAAEGVEMPNELHVSLASSANEGAYPIASYTYLLVYDDARDANKEQALARFVWWAIHDGQKYAKDLDYAPLPAEVVRKVESRLKALRAGGKRVLDGA